MNTACIDINSRYYLAPSNVPETLSGFDVIDRALEYQFRPAVVFSNGTETECREWVERNCDEPVEHTKGDFIITPPESAFIMVVPGLRTYEVSSSLEEEQNWVAQVILEEDAHLFKTAPKLLALLEQYHSSMPTKESGKLICEARGWTIQE